MITKLTSKLTSPLKSSHSKGFTLAEILITLTVIGVVAALTIPTLLQNTNQAELKAAWKKAYGDISQASLLIMNDNGGDLVNAFPDHNIMRDKYLEKLSYIKSCEYGTSRGNCFASSIYGLNGFLFPNDWWNVAGAVLTNGTSLEFLSTSSDCTGYRHFIQKCGDITVDVNGLKKPNTFGKDIYFIHVKKDGLLPGGITGDQFVGDCSSSGDGWSCSAVYLYQ